MRYIRCRVMLGAWPTASLRGRSRSPGTVVTRSRRTWRHPLEGDGQASVVVLHHMPGYDRASKEIARTFAVYGYAALMPNLHHRYAPGCEAGDAAAAARDAGGVPDEQCLGDVAGRGRLPARPRPESNGKVGVIGYCSGGRQTFLVACTLDVDAAVDCYGGRADIDLAPNLRCPLLGLFGDRRSEPVARRRGRDGHARSRPTARRSTSTPTKAPATPSSRSTGRRTASRRPRTGGSRSGRSSAST